MKKKTFKGTIENLPANEVYINVYKLEKGEYILKITHKNKVIKQVHFTKTI